MSWGICTMVIGAVRNFAGLLIVRVLLGIFESGLFPGIIYCLTFWYKQDERALRAALIVGTATLGMCKKIEPHALCDRLILLHIAGAFGGAIAFGVGHMNEIRNLPGWRWLFIIEGAPSCACAVLVFFFYPDFPETSKWLSDDERFIATERIKGIASLGHDKLTWANAKATLLDWRLYLHYATCIGFSVGFSNTAPL